MKENDRATRCGTLLPISIYLCVNGANSVWYTYAGFGDTFRLCGFNAKRTRRKQDGNEPFLYLLMLKERSALVLSRVFILFDVYTTIPSSSLHTISLALSLLRSFLCLSFLCLSLSTFFHRTETWAIVLIPKDGLTSLHANDDDDSVSVVQLIINARCVVNC